MLKCSSKALAAYLALNGPSASGSAPLKWWVMDGDADWLDCSSKLAGGVRSGDAELSGELLQHPGLGS